MAKVKFIPNKGALRAIMQSTPVTGLVVNSANKMRATANSMGSGKYAVSSAVGSVSAHAFVKTTDIVSRKSNAKHNTLLKSISAGGV